MNKLDSNLVTLPHYARQVDSQNPERLPVTVDLQFAASKGLKNKFTNLIDADLTEAKTSIRIHRIASVLIVAVSVSLVVAGILLIAFAPPAAVGAAAAGCGGCISEMAEAGLLLLSAGGVGTLLSPIYLLSCFDLMDTTDGFSSSIRDSDTTALNKKIRFLREMNRKLSNVSDLTVEEMTTLVMSNDINRKVIALEKDVRNANVKGDLFTQKILSAAKAKREQIEIENKMKSLRGEVKDFANDLSDEDFDKFRAVLKKNNII